MLFLLQYSNLIRCLIILLYFIVFLNVSFSLEESEPISSIYYGTEVRSDVYIKPHPDTKPPIIESLDSLKEETSSSNNLPKIPFNVAITIVATGLIIQTYCFYYQDPVGWWPFSLLWTSWK